MALIQRLARRERLLYLKTSAKSNSFVKDAFVELIKQILRFRKKNKSGETRKSAHSNISYGNLILTQKTINLSRSTGKENQEDLQFVGVAKTGVLRSLLVVYFELSRWWRDDINSLSIQ